MIEILVEPCHTYLKFLLANERQHLLPFRSQREA